VAVYFFYENLKLIHALLKSYKFIYMELYEMLVGLNVLDDGKIVERKISLEMERLKRSNRS